MLSRLSGTIWHIGEGHLTVRIGGLGLQVRVPTNAMSGLSEGDPIELFTHLHVRENELALYGFRTADEREIFELLLTVSGVGPKVALTLLSTITPDTLRQAVAQEKPALLSRVPGIGTKTAKAIILHLKDKLALGAGVSAPPVDETDTEVIAALTALGFSLVEAQAALQSLPRDTDLPVEERVRRALAYFAASPGR